MKKLKLSLVDGKEVMKIDSLEILPGSHWLIRGNSGTGKTTFLKALAGIWQYGEGTIMLPESRMMFLPQETYLPLGSLRTALCYPEDPDNYSVSECQKVLAQCGLGQYILEIENESDITWCKNCLWAKSKDWLLQDVCLYVLISYLWMKQRPLWITLWRKDYLNVY